MPFRKNLNNMWKGDIPQELAWEGFYVFPIKAGTKDQPLTKWGKGGPGECATTDLRTIKHWWEKWPRANIGIFFCVLSLTRCSCRPLSWFVSFDVALHGSGGLQQGLFSTRLLVVPSPRS